MRKSLPEPLSRWVHVGDLRKDSAGVGRAGLQGACKAIQAPGGQQQQEVMTHREEEAGGPGPGESCSLGEAGAAW